jgi:hypothetical protein
MTTLPLVQPEKSCDLGVLVRLRRIHYPFQIGQPSFEIL